MIKLLATVCGVLLLTASCKKSSTNDESCPKPIIGSLHENSGSMNLEISGSNDFYEIEYGTNGFSQGSGTKITTNAQHTISNLTNGAYDIYVRGNCGGNEWSNWNGPRSFLVQNGTQASNCTKPTNLRMNDPSGFYWDYPNNSLFQVEYGVNGFTRGSGKLGLSNSKSYSDFSMAANTTYDFYVRSICGPGDTSAWAGPQTYYSSGNWRMCLPPTGLTASRSGGCIQFNFDANGEWSFETVINNSPTTNFTNPDPTGSTGGAYCGLYSNVTYYFFVRSVCSNGNKTAWAGPVTIY